MHPRKPAISAAAEPKYGNHFDPWHSASTGNQRAETRLPITTGWRQSRSIKLSHQFKSESEEGGRIFDAMEKGSEIRDVKGKVPTSGDIGAGAQCNAVDRLNGKSRVLLTEADDPATKEKQRVDIKEHERIERKRGIFDGLVIYINGSTYPLISDHKLKQLLAENGAKLSLHLSRRQVTHVILGKPCGTRGVGAGGGLAGSKLEKEIRKVGGRGIKYVGAEWVLESLKAGKRQAEAPFVNLKIAAKGQQSVYSIFKKPYNPAPTVTGRREV